MKCHRFTFGLVIAISGFIAPLSGSLAFAEDLPPWALRDHYSFAGEKATFHYDVQRAIWKLEVLGLGDFIREVQAEIVLEDDSVVRFSQLTKESDQREKFSGEMGTGSLFRTTFAPHNGLVVRCAVARFTERPFLVVYIDAVNKGETPISIKAIRPAVVDAGGINANGSELTVKRIKTGQRGTYSTVHRRDDSSLYQFDLPAQGVSFALGVLQSGKMDSHVNLLPSNETWQGSVECVFTPPLVLSPGEEVKADPLWVSFSTPDSDTVRQFFGWAQSTLGKRRTVSTPLRGWLAVPDGGSAAELLAEAERWKTAALRHVLAPVTWEGRPGSLDGAAPQFPKNMAEFAAAAKKIGMTPGISVDPLRTDEGSNEWIKESPSGERWLNPAHKDGRAHAVERMRKVAGWGYQFFVVAPSSIPDGALAAFDITRSEADSLAFEIVAEAAGDKPVTPSPSMTLAADTAQWIEAAEATRWLREYGVVAGPIRLEADGVESLDPALIKAIEDFGGPVEVVGQPGKQLRTQLGAALHPGVKGIAPKSAERGK